MIINNLMKDIAGCERGDVLTILAAHISLLAVHSKALACHSECLGMSAENSCAAYLDECPSYSQKDYLKVMLKWELVDEKGNPII